MCRLSDFPVAPDAKTRFSGRASAYSKYRPSYPEGLIDVLHREGVLQKTSTVADIGSGTGLLTQLFLKNGNDVFAVEPNADMRSAAENLLSAYPGFHSANGSAESTGLSGGSVDLVVAGQAFHWFSPAEAKKEFGRISRNGTVAVIYNTRDDAEGLGLDYRKLTARFGRNFSEVMGPVEDRLRVFFSSYKLLTLPNPKQLDLDSLLGRLLSASYMPAEGEAGYEAMVAEVEEMFARHESGGMVTMRMTTELFLGTV